MYKSGSILHGLSTFSREPKNKYTVILDRSEDEVILSSFLTSQERSGSLNPIHGCNPTKEAPMSYVFKANIEIGITAEGKPFSFKKDTTVVPDFGIIHVSLDVFRSKYKNIEKQCQLYDEEYINLIYTLYKSNKTTLENKIRFEKIMETL